MDFFVRNFDGFHMEIFHMHFLASTPFPTYNDREAFFALLTNSNAFECEPGRFIYDLSGFLCVCLVLQLIGENPAIAEPAEKIIRNSRVNNTGEKKKKFACSLDGSLMMGIAIGAVKFSQ